MEKVCNAIPWQWFGFQDWSRQLQKRLVLRTCKPVSWSMCVSNFFQPIYIRFLHLNLIMFCRRDVDNMYEKTTWTVKFKLKNVNRNGTYTLRLALASAQFSNLQVFRTIYFVNLAALNISRCFLKNLLFWFFKNLIIPVVIIKFSWVRQPLLQVYIASITELE